MTTIGKLTVMQAFLDGKKIQRKLKGDPDSEYVNLGEEPEWNWEAYSFRVRPEPMEIKVLVKDSGQGRPFVIPDQECPMVIPSYTLRTFVEKV